MEYIIVGIEENGTREFLARVIKGDLKYAKEILERMLNNPTKDDLVCMEGLHNFRIKEVINPKKEWWNW